MSRTTIAALRVVIAVALAGSLVVQLGLAPLLWLDLDGAPAWVRVALVAVVVLGVATLQVVGVSVWRLLGMVRRGTVFSRAAFRHVDAVVAALACAAALVLSVAVVAAVSNRTTPGDAVAPGLVGLVCGAALVVGGVALVVVVLRALLAQAVDLDATNGRLRAELAEVI